MELTKNVNPDYRITANQSDITLIIKERFISLHYTDEAGIDSDVLEITLADNDPNKPIDVPPTGAELDLSLGYDGQFQRIGLFVVDEIEIAICPGAMTIRARAAPFDASSGGKSNLQTQKTRSWPDGTKLSDMVKKIAKEHGMDAAVAAPLQSIVLPHIDQTDESDMHFLVRLAKKYDAVVKPANGQLILAKVGAAKTVSGQDLPTITLAPADVHPTSLRVLMSTRETAGMVVAYWHSIETAKRHEAKVGTGEPVKRLKTQYPTEEMALAAARSELDRKDRGKVTASLSIPGRSDAIAEGRLILAGFRAGVDGEWSITKAEHAMDASGYITTVELEQPNGSATPNVMRRAINEAEKMR